jgi:hypothetical protein
VRGSDTIETDLCNVAINTNRRSVTSAGPTRLRGAQRPNRESWRPVYDILVREGY